jgi:hypothetical protein
MGAPVLIAEISNLKERAIVNNSLYNISVVLSYVFGGTHIFIIILKYGFLVGL